MSQRKQGALKEVISTRLPRRIYDHAVRDAKSQGVSTAMWLRRLIVTHLHLSDPRSKR